MPVHNAVTNLEDALDGGQVLDVSAAEIEATQLDVNKIVPSTGTDVEIEATTITLDGTVAATTVAASTVSSTLMYAPQLQCTATASVTATADGLTTGLIPARTSFVAVSSANADYIVTLPAGTIGDVIRLLIGATGCELRCATAGDKINNVVCGATNEAALVATTMYTCMYVAANTWVMHGLTNLGADEAEVVPDAR